MNPIGFPTVAVPRLARLADLDGRPASATPEAPVDSTTIGGSQPPASVPGPVQDSPGGQPAPVQAPPPPAAGSEPPPLKPGEVASSEKPSNPTLGKIEWLPTQTTTITRTYQVPVTHPEVLGRIPSDYYQPAWMGPWPGFGSSIYFPIGGTFGTGQVDVVRDVPDYNADGSAKKEAVTRTLTETTYDQKKRTFGFGLAAAAAGAGAAALVGALKGAAVGPVGMLVGGLLGGAAGAAIGYKSAIGDKVCEQWMTDAISHPSLIGYNQWMTPDYRTEYDHRQVPDGHGGWRTETTSRQVLQGWWVRHDPEIRWRRVGEYEYPTLQHTGKIGPVAGTFMAIGAGAVAGVGVGLAIGLL